MAIDVFGDMAMTCPGCGEKRELVDFAEYEALELALDNIVNDERSDAYDSGVDDGRGAAAADPGGVNLQDAMTDLAKAVAAGDKSSAHYLLDALADLLAVDGALRHAVAIAWSVGLRDA